MRTAQEAGLALCRTCRTLTDRPGEKCVVCGAKTASRSPQSLQLVWAFWVAGIIAYIPGNLMPIMITQSVAGDSPSTIMSGVISLIHHGSFEIAAVIFIASIVVPVSKFIIIAWLALSIQFRWSLSEHRRHFAHEAVELIGRWSMIDVFVVAALAALIQVGALMSILPGVGVNAFALSVIFTMLSAMSFDPRLIWDSQQTLTEPEHGRTRT
ncbi:MAG: paraquat-inducible protein A [Pseudomonadota bacterium]